MKVHETLEQGTQEWLRVRAGKITGTGVERILDASNKARSGAMPKTYLHQLVGERLKGRPIDEIGGDWIDRGRELEAEARRWLAFELGQEITEVGFIESDCGRYGFSPDGHVFMEQGVELKCPALKTHLGYLLEPATLEKKYHHQVQFAMWVAGWNRVALASYCPEMPPVLRIVGVDKKAHAAYDSVIPAFADKVDAAVAKIRAMTYGDDDLGRAAAEVFG